MSLLTTLKKDQLDARKSKDSVKAQLLTTLIGEAEMVGKNDGNRPVLDQEVVAVVKKFIKNLDETIRIAGDYKDTISLEKAKAEKDILESFLPKQLSEAELRVVIQDIIAKNSLAGPKAMGALMKELKAAHDGTYDGGLASKISKDLLA